MWQYDLVVLCFILPLFCLFAFFIHFDFFLSLLSISFLLFLRHIFRACFGISRGACAVFFLSGLKRISLLNAFDLSWIPHQIPANYAMFWAWFCFRTNSRGTTKTNSELATITLKIGCEFFFLELNLNLFCIYILAEKFKRNQMSFTVLRIRWFVFSDLSNFDCCCSMDSTSNCHLQKQKPKLMNFSQICITNKSEWRQKRFYFLF